MRESCQLCHPAGALPKQPRTSGPSGGPPSPSRPLEGAPAPFLPVRRSSGPVAAPEVDLLVHASRLRAAGRKGVFRPGPQRHPAATSCPKAAPQLATSGQKCSKSLVDKVPPFLPFRDLHLPVTCSFGAQLLCKQMGASSTLPRGWLQLGLNTQVS